MPTTDPLQWPPLTLTRGRHQLTPLWQILFDEGRLGAHILFNPLEIAALEHTDLDGLDSTQLASLAQVMRGAVVYRDLVHFLQNLPKLERAAAYRLYRIWLEAHTSTMQAPMPLH